MKKFATLTLSLVLVLSPFWMSAYAVAETVTSDETIDESSVIETEENQSSNQSSTTNSTSSESSESTSESQESSSQEAVTESKKETRKYQVTFRTDAKHNFSSNTTERTIEKEEDSKLAVDEIPSTDQLGDFVGWKVNGHIYSTEMLTSLAITEDIEAEAEFKEVTLKGTNIKTNTSIKDIFNVADKTKVIVVPDPTDKGIAYKEYLASEVGVKTALNDLYQNGAGEDYVLYIGTTVTLSAATVAKTVPTPVTAANATFYSLAGKVGTLTITGNSEDPITKDIAVPAGSKTLALGANIHFGTDVQFRNINYTGTSIYMNGKSLTLNGGSSGNGFSIYGGTDVGDVSGSPVITIETTGIGAWNVYGGNKTSGTLTGNPTIYINNTTRTFDTVAGGAQAGTVKGNTFVRISNSGATFTNIYGGGVGTTANPANVTGNVETEITSTVATAGNKIGTYHGGVSYGDIQGAVINNISGYGSWTDLVRNFYGGTKAGNIGTDRTQPAITSNVDTSQFTYGSANFIGANENTGTVKGHISNVIKAGTLDKGSFNRVDGAAGMEVSVVSLTTGTDAAYDAMTKEQRRAYAEKTAKFLVYGNVSTKIIEGAVSKGGDNNAFTRGAGYGGYIEGNTSVEVGTVHADGTAGGEGYAYNPGGAAYKNNLPYTNTNNSRSSGTGAFDIVGGGGTNAARATNIYIYGDTSAILNNVLARWTYGGGFSGVIEGNTSMTMNGGVVDTLEGAGYTGKRIYGNSRATLNNGQVDWFLSGGGWWDQKIVGDVGVTVYDGIINASVGGTFGYTDDHIITGDSKNYIYGGDFSGKNHSTSVATREALAGGPTYAGSILGDSELTIDLREYDGQFGLPTGTSISGGIPYAGTTKLGTNTSNTVTLNVFTKPGLDVLNGASLYGDGGSSAVNTKSGSIIMNIQASGSKVGNFYATNYSNISAGKILRNVEMNIQGVSSINGLSGGNNTDSLTNKIVSDSSNKITINVGQNVDETGVYQKDPINVNGVGIVNFTEMTITNGTKLMANAGSVKNSSVASAGNHLTDYNGFGSIHLSKGAGFGISPSNTTGIISIGKLTVEDEGTVESLPGAGKINISDFETPDELKDRLTWITTSPAASLLTKSEGTWFGESQAFQVLTVNPTKNNALNIKPANFTGIDKNTGKTYIGDNDIKKTGSGYGIAIPGSIIDYEVEIPGVADGDGMIAHNVSQVKENNEPLSLDAWGTERANKQVKKGRLVIPMGHNILPTLTFTPETDITGSWFYSGKITSTKIGQTDQEIGEQTNSKAVDWSSMDGEYSYTVKVKYSNKAELSGEHVFITETEAKAITKEQIYAYTSAQGRPFLTDDITEKMVSDIQQPLGLNDVSRVHQVTYTSGKTAVNKVSQVYNLVVVRDESSISSDRSTALYAKAARFKLEEANALADDVELNTHTWAQVLFADGRASVKPTIDPTAFNAIKYVTSDELSKNVETKYSYINGSVSLTKIVNVLISGELKIVEVPAGFNFGNQMVSSQTQTYWPTITGNLTVEDTRGGDKGKWQMTVAETTPLSSGTTTLSETMYFENGLNEQLLSKNAVIVEETTLQQDGQFVISNQWGETKDKGLKLKIPVAKQRLGTYEGTLTWTLVSGPGN
ncbi:hypothetical protein IGI37_003823 [Enterococcus sp. AZ194]|uniref:hypothetical protein n=1 Tax=Enterococcus sp. AZ194 TaxID=2774629 RepID=UPI003F22FEA2